MEAEQVRDQLRDVLRERVLPELQRRRADDGPYVPRQLVREGGSRDPFWASLLRANEGDVPEAVTEGGLLEMPWAVVTGSAGSGKSVVLRDVVHRAVQRYLSEDGHPAPLWLDLEVIGGADAYDALDALHEGWLGDLSQSGEPIALYVDGLYEGVRRLGEGELRIVLSRLRQRLRPARTLVGCRSIAWTDGLRDALHPAPTQDSVRAVYSVDPLEREAYEHLLPNRHERASFFDACAEAGVQDLLESVFSGFWLARQYALGVPIPTSRSECLDEQVRQRLARRSGGTGPSIGRLVELAGLVGVVSTFSDPGPWTVLDVIDRLGASSVVRAEVSPTEEEVRALLDTALFHGSADGYVFAHQLLREHVTARALSSLSTSSLGTLLTVEVGARDRVVPAFRPLAAMVAEEQRDWGDRVAGLDPLALLFSEGDTGVDLTRLVRAVVGEAVGRGEPPWIEVAPTGDKAWWLLSGHRPEDPSRVIRGWLQSNAPLRRQWGAVCALAWGGVSGANAGLVRLALDDEERTSTRQYAIAAVVKTGSRRHLERLRPLAQSADDLVRGEAIRARMAEGVPALDVLPLFEGGPANESLYGSLQRSAREFGLGLDADDVRPVLNAIALGVDRFGRLRHPLVDGVVERAREVGLGRAPVELVAAIARGGGFWGDVGEDVASWMRESPAFWDDVLQWAFERAGAGEYTPYRLPDLLANGWTDGRADILRELDAQTIQQTMLVRGIVSGVGFRDRSEARIQHLRRILGALGEHLPAPVRERDPATSEEAREAFQRALDGHADTPSHRIRQVFEAAVIVRDIGGSQVEDPLFDEADLLGSKEGTIRAKGVVGALALAPVGTQRDIVDAMVSVVESADYPAWDASDGVGQGPNDAADRVHRAVHVLLVAGEPLETAVLEDAATSFGLRRYRPELSATRILNTLQSQDVAAWGRAVRSIYNVGDAGANAVLAYLTDLESPLLVAQVTESLGSDSLSTWELDRRVYYLATIKPPGWADALWEVYARHEVAADASSDARWAELRPLFPLLGIGDERAWTELERRVAEGLVPTKKEEYPYAVRLNVSDAAGRERVLLDWYRLVRERSAGSDDTDATLLAQSLLGPVLRSGRPEGLTILKGFRSEGVFAGAQWLSFPIREYEDRLMNELQEPVASGPLLDTVVRESLRLVRDGRDLTTAVVAALGEIQAELRAGEGVAGFWNEPSVSGSPNPDYDPKKEEGCQSVLWPRLRAKLAAYGVRTVEEEFIGPNRADLLVEAEAVDGGQATTIIEAKVARSGYGPARLVRPVRTQLYAEYLRPRGVTHGVYVVFWFKGERYDGPAGWSSPARLLGDVRAEAETLVPLGARVESVVLDVSGPWREQ